MNEFLELASYDWLLSEPQGENVYEDIALAESLHCEFSRVPLTTLLNVVANAQVSLLRG